MTRRERLEARLERRREWADKRRTRANAQLSSNPELRHDWAFITQPGHIPERARMNRADDRAMESLGVARHHEAKASGLEAQLERAIFSDDPDAVEQLEAKAAKLEAEADKCKAMNAAYRKAKGAPGWATAAGFEGEAAARVEERAVKLFASCPWERAPWPAYHLANVRANARRLRARVEEVKRRQVRQDAAEEGGGVTVTATDTPSGKWCCITFAEKPSRSILAGLKAAGFAWSGGSWHGMAPRRMGDAAILCPDGADGLRLWEALVAALEMGGEG